MNKRRLLKLADLLEKDAKNKKGIKFDLDTFGKVEDSGKRLSCETTACAIGLAALSGAFRRQGLSAQIDYDGLVTVIYDNLEDFEAAAALFELSAAASHWLFHPSKYQGRVQVGSVGERVVAKRIRDFVAGRAAPTYG